MDERRLIHLQDLVATDAAAVHVPWPVQVTTHPGLDMSPAFSPRGDALAFTSDRSGRLEIYVRALGEGATESALTADGGQNVQPAWSPDGMQLAYHSNRSGGIWVMPARGGVARQVAAEGSRPAWSPDGLRIAYQSDEHVDVTPSAYGASAGSTIWITQADGTGARALTSSARPLGGHASPAWSPDGRFIGFTVFDGGRDNGAWIVDCQTGLVTQLESGVRVYEMVFAPDGGSIYMAGGEALIYRLPFDPRTGARRGPTEPIALPGVPRCTGAVGVRRRHASQLRRPRSQQPDLVAADSRRRLGEGRGHRAHLGHEPPDLDGRDLTGWIAHRLHVLAQRRSAECVGDGCRWQPQGAGDVQ